MARHYYILVCRDTTPAGNGEWVMEFGDYDKECVDFERDDCIYSDRFEQGRNARKNCRVLKVKSANKTAIAEAVAALNARD